jgi:hypothetical protein
VRVSVFELRARIVHYSKQAWLNLFVLRILEELGHYMVHAIAALIHLFN